MIKNIMFISPVLIGLLVLFSLVYFGRYNGYNINGSYTKSYTEIDNCIKFISNNREHKICGQYEIVPLGKYRTLKVNNEN